MPFFERNEKISIFYLDEGPQDATVVLLIPGITCDLHDWNWQVPFLLEHGFRVITPDPRGQGRSSAPDPTPNIRSWPGPDSDPTIVDYYPQSTAHDFIALLGHLNISSVVLIAHSLGTAVAYHLASVRPDLTRALVVFDALHSVPSATADEYLTDPQQVLQNLVMLFGEALYPPTVPAWHNTWVGRRAAQGSMEVVLAQCWACLGDPNGIGRREISVAQHDGKIKCPRLTLGNSSFWVSTEKTYLSPSTELDEVHLVEGAGHWFFQLKSDKVNHMLKKWFVRIGLV
ncbi:alpha beta hydrolase fold protein [Colletotrichum karsti]|uniref:Alpha beta hydrolase fold protein n=1 Tax=Colletotrichum karsti TaxID=1095194 RepID=A0A9P6HXF4_9PEZI|nr:alpha beta hydrolase fold protein [Colletotrichum karsti]KAF9872329.1 alpha beta hydrolase fold protein [Colletotrichum karsti]